jgi:hypothetical protein
MSDSKYNSKAVSELSSLCEIETVAGNSSAHIIDAEILLAAESQNIMSRVNVRILKHAPENHSKPNFCSKLPFHIFTQVAFQVQYYPPVRAY